jgi:hypothetical protein
VEKNGVFLKYQCYDHIFAYFSSVLSQKRQFFVEFFGEIILEIITDEFVKKNRRPQHVTRPIFCQKVLRNQNCGKKVAQKCGPL